MLVRSAFSANIKERRDCSTALFDAARPHDRPGRAHPRPPRRHARRGRRRAGARPGAGRGLDPQRPVHRRHASPRHHARLADGRSASRSRAPTTRTSAGPSRAACPADSHRLDEEGVVIPPTRLDDGGAGRARRADAQPGRAARRPSRPARRAPPRRARGWTSSAPAAAQTRVAPAMDELHAYSERRRRAPRSRASRTAATRRADVLEAATAASSRSVSRVTIAGDELELDFAGTAPQHDGNLNCPLAVTRSACYFVVRCLDRPGHSRLRRRLRAGHGARARGVARERALARRGRGRERRDLEPHRRRSSSPRSARRCPSPRRARGR